MRFVGHFGFSIFKWEFIFARDSHVPKERSCVQISLIVKVAVKKSPCVFRMASSRTAMPPNRAKSCCARDLSSRPLPLFLDRDVSKSRNQGVFKAFAMSVFDTAWKSLSKVSSSRLHTSKTVVRSMLS